MTHLCPGALGRSCGVTIPEDRERCGTPGPPQRQEGRPDLDRDARRGGAVSARVAAAVRSVGYLEALHDLAEAVDRYRPAGEDPLFGDVERPLEAMRSDLGEGRFWAKVANGEGCWEWRAARYPTGYGHCRWAGKSAYAHRIAYLLVRGSIPSGLEIDHLCRNRACVRPDHLEAVTHRENVRRGLNGILRPPTTKGA